MGRKLILGLSILILQSCSISRLAYSQQTNTVFAKIISAAVVDDTTTAVPSKYMRGQPYHMATAVFSDRPTRTCSSVIHPVSFNIPSLTIYGSYDNVTFVDMTLYTRPINPGSQSATNRYRMMTSASGAFPYLQLSISNWNSTDCKVDVYYAGTIQSLDIKKYADFGTIADSIATNAVQISGAATTTILPGIPNARIAVYGWTLFNSATNNILFQEVRTDAGTIPKVPLNNTAAGVTLQTPNTNFPLFITSGGSTLNIVTTGAGTLSGVIQYRYE